MPYIVEEDQPGCTACEAGKTWCVVRPDGTALGTSYGDKADADQLAGLLNDAYKDGCRANNRRVGPDDRRRSGHKGAEDWIGENLRHPTIEGRREFDDGIPF